MRTYATMTKMTAKGLSTWSFVECDGILIGFGGTTNRCRVFKSHQQMQQCIINFAGYGYKMARSKAQPVAKPQRVTKPAWDKHSATPESPQETGLLQTVLECAQVTVVDEPQIVDATDVVVATPIF